MAGLCTNLNCKTVCLDPRNWLMGRWDSRQTASSNPVASFWTVYDLPRALLQHEIGRVLGDWPVPAGVQLPRGPCVTSGVFSQDPANPLKFRKIPHGPGGGRGRWEGGALRKWAWRVAEGPLSRLLIRLRDDRPSNGEAATPTPTLWRGRFK